VITLAISLTLSMIIILLFVATWYVLLSMCSWSWWWACAVHFGSVFLLALPGFKGSTWLRSSLLADAVVGWLLRTRLDDTSRQRLAKLDGKRQHVLLGEPHGQVPLHLYLLAAFGSHVPRHVAENTVVMAHWLISLLPFACQLCQLCGVVFSLRCTVDWALDRSYNVAACMSGLLGKHKSMLNETLDVVGSTVFVSTSERNGMLALAARRGALIVPIMVPRIDLAFANTRFLKGLPLSFLTVTLGGEFFLRPFCDVEVRVGAPIDPRRLGIDAECAADIGRLRRLFYRELEKLAQPEYVVRYY
jgi:hypothetical protein